MGVTVKELGIPLDGSDEVLDALGALEAEARQAGRRIHASQMELHLAAAGACALRETFPRVEQRDVEELTPAEARILSDLSEHVLAIHHGRIELSPKGERVLQKMLRGVTE